MKIVLNDIVATVNRGEMKVYKAVPRTLEAEAGLKNDEVKLDLILDKDYIAAHKKLRDIVTDEAGRFKGDAQQKGGSIGQEHNLEEEIEKRLYKLIAEDLENILKEAPRVFLAINEEFANEVLNEVDKELKNKLTHIVKKDYVKLPKEELLKKIVL